MSLVSGSTARDNVRVVSIVEGTASSQPLYVANRDPLLPSGLIKLPIGSITPRGWLRHQLDLEANGMTFRQEQVGRLGYSYPENLKNGALQDRAIQAALRWLPDDRRSKCPSAVWKSCSASS